MTPVEVILLSGVMTMIGSTLAWFLARRDKRDDRQHSSTTPTPPSTQEVWNRLDKLERRTLPAVVGVFNEIIDQLPEGFRPRVSKRYVAVLTEEGYLPENFEYEERG